MMQLMHRNNLERSHTLSVVDQPMKIDLTLATPISIETSSNLTWALQSTSAIRISKVEIESKELTLQILTV